VIRRHQPSGSCFVTAAAGFQTPAEARASPHTKQFADTDPQHRCELLDWLALPIACRSILPEWTFGQSPNCD
jgi:hypothetical protein